MTGAVSFSKYGPMLSGPAAILFSSLVNTVVSLSSVTGSQNILLTTGFGLYSL